MTMNQKKPAASEKKISATKRVLAHLRVMLSAVKHPAVYADAT
jgi:hypothetical protein